MSKPVYQIDSNVEYTKVAPWTWEFRGPVQLISLFKKPNLVVQTSRNGFKVLDFQKVPGPPVDGEHLFRMKLERL